MALVKPTAYQINALSSLEEIRKNKALTVLPSGSGKTYLAAFDCKAINAKSILYIVHRNEILEQSKKIFSEVLGLKEQDIGIVNGDSKQFDKDYIFASIMTLANPKSIEQIQGRRFDYVIIDEFHHVAAQSYQTVLESLQYGFLHGLTATPYRLDGKDVMAYVDKNIIYSRNLEEAITDGELVPFLYNGLWDDVDYSSIKWQGYKYRENDLNKALLIDARDKAIIKNFKELVGVGTRQTIGFCVSVKHAERMAAKFNQAGIPSMAITWKTDYEERRSLIQLFRQKRYQVVFTRDIFNEGVDFPEVEALLFLRPTVSKTVFYQQIGRGLRKAPNKENVIVLDFIGNYNNAWRIEEWLEFARASEEPLRHNQRKPEYHYALSRVYFDREVIDLFERQRSSEITKENIIADYFRLKKEYGGRPSYHLFTHPRKSRFSINSIIRRFGSWSNFLKSIGEERKYTMDMVQNYNELKKRLGRRPRTTDLQLISDSEYTHGDYIKTYGSYTKFLRAIGEHFRGYNRQDAIDNYFSVKRSLGGRIPSTRYLGDKSISRFGILVYKKFWGTFGNFLKEIEKEHTTYDQISHFRRLRVQDMYRNLATKLNKNQPTQSEWVHEYGRKGLKIIWKEYGTVRELQKALNLSPDTAYCHHCNKEFPKYRPRHMFCSEICSKAFFRDKYHANRRLTGHWEKTHWSVDSK